MDWIKNKSNYASLNEEERAELSPLCDDEASFERVKALILESEKMLLQEAPQSVLSNLDSLFDETYATPKSNKGTTFTAFHYGLLAVAAVVVTVLMIYPVINEEPPSKPLADGKTSKVNVKNPVKVDSNNEKHNKQIVEQQPMLANLDEKDTQGGFVENSQASTASMEELPEAETVLAEEAKTSGSYSPSESSTYKKDDQLLKTIDHEPKGASRTVIEDLIQDKNEERTDQLMGVSLSKGKSKVSLKKINTGSMLKKIKPLF